MLSLAQVFYKVKVYIASGFEGAWLQPRRQNALIVYGTAEAVTHQKLHAQ